MVTRRELYSRIPPLPGRPTFPEAVRATKKLHRFVRRQKCHWDFEETSGNRYTWVRGNTCFINVDKGWGDFIHLLSHYLHRASTGENHSKDHARLELRMRKEVLRRGWLDGRLKDKGRVKVPPSPIDKIQKRRDQIIRLERKIKGLTTRLKTAKRSLSALERNQKKTQQPPTVEV